MLFVLTNCEESGHYKEGHPPLTFSDAHVDVGELEQGEERALELLLVNSHMHVVSVESVRTSCGCVVLGEQVASVSGRGRSTIAAKLTTERLAGRISQFVRVEWVDESCRSMGTAIVELRAVVRAPAIVADPLEVVLLEEVDGSVKPAVFSVFRRDSLAMTVVRVACTSADIVAQVRCVGLRCAEVEVRKLAGSGSADGGEVEVYVSDGAVPALRVPVRWVRAMGACAGPQGDRRVFDLGRRRLGDEVAVALRGESGQVIVAKDAAELEITQQCRSQLGVSLLMLRILGSVSEAGQKEVELLSGSCGDRLATIRYELVERSEVHEPE